LRFHPLIGAAALMLAACQSGETPAPQASEARKIAPVITGADAIDIHSFAKPL